MHLAQVPASLCGCWRLAWRASAQVYGSNGYQAGTRNGGGSGPIGNKAIAWRYFILARERFRGDIRADRERALYRLGILMTHQSILDRRVEGAKCDNKPEKKVRAIHPSPSK